MKLWEKHRDNISEDVKNKSKQGNIDLYLDIVYNQCLILLEDMTISMSGKALLQFGFFPPSREARFAISNHQCESIAIAVASSGIAATLIDGSKKAHSAFKLHHSESVNCNISKQSDMTHVLREAKLIWDECTKAHNVTEALSRTL
ncbi:ATP-dependent DNA helicase [Trichonephila clavipes]|nr:ATP-dependent DNA helicase [Trichonephila clavipes]